MNNVNVQVRQVLGLVLKYHFWILCALVVIIGTIFWFVASSRLARATEERRTQLQQARDQVAKVRSVSDHPNSKVIAALRQEHRRLIDIVYRAWEELYKDQRERNQWPRQLGAEFLNVINSLGPDDEIPVQYREVYQYFIKNHFPEWYDIIDLRLPPKRDAQGNIMKDENGRPLKQDPFERTPAGMATPYAGGYPGSATYTAPETGYPGETYAGSTVTPTSTGPGDDRIGIVEWNLQDLQRIRAQFDWPTTPTTFEVRLAQENLWVYEALLWIIRETNAGATSYYNAPIKRIESLQIGQEAAVSLLQAQSRLFGAGMFAAGATGPGSPEGAPGTGLGGMMTMPGLAPGMPMGSMMMPGMGSSYYPSDYGPGGPEGGPGMGMPGMPGAGAATSASREEMIRQRLTHFRYVDKEGKPLAADAPHPFAEFKMMPVRMLVYMDQRRIPRLLVNCANSPMPVQVRVVSLRPGQGRQVNLGLPTGPGGSPYPGMGSMGSMMGMGPPMGSTAPYGGETYPGASETYGGYGYGDTMGRPGLGASGETGSVDVPVEIAGIIFIFNPPDRSKVGKLGEAEAPGAVGMPTLEQAISSLAQPAAQPGAQPTAPGTALGPAAPQAGVPGGAPAAAPGQPAAGAAQPAAGPAQAPPGPAPGGQPPQASAAPGPQPPPGPVGAAPAQPPAAAPSGAVPFAPAGATPAPAGPPAAPPAQPAPQPAAPTG
ncbi:MAG: hypothetical protein NZ899_05440 [Thermoguttaceae bacterium]|nr:hypothetical protein [Thermoguttaceae bacterium]MDW8078241.1 hypothetical protein [Thermoguttaceae bacterium]